MKNISVLGAEKHSRRSKVPPKAERVSFQPLIAGASSSVGGGLRELNPVIAHSTIVFSTAALEMI